MDYNKCKVNENKYKSDFKWQINNNNNYYYYMIIYLINLYC